jgi:hypothetical protein
MGVPGEQAKLASTRKNQLLESFNDYVKPKPIIHLANASFLDALLLASLDGLEGRPTGEYSEGLGFRILQRLRKAKTYYLLC